MQVPIVPRRSLLPPYMNHEAWLDLADVIDEVFGEMVDNNIEALRYLRELFIYDERENEREDFVIHPVQEKINARAMVGPVSLDVYDTITDRIRLNQLGLRILDPTVMDNAALHRIVRHIGSFWYIKGVETFLDFISYMLNTTVEYFNLWTKDYVNFFKEGDPSIGTPKWNGGVWYPTTHIRIDISNSNLNQNQLVNFVRLYYDIANYNLVLESIETVQWNFILPDSVGHDTYPTDGDNTVPVEAPIVALAQVHVRVDYISSPNL